MLLPLFHHVKTRDECGHANTHKTLTIVPSSQHIPEKYNDTVNTITNCCRILRRYADICVLRCTIIGAPASGYIGRFH